MSTKTVVGIALVDDFSAPTYVVGASRKYPEWARGMWEFPGGKVEIGETPEEALHREIREELGCEVTLGARVNNPNRDDSAWDLTSPGHNQGLRMFVYLGKVYDGEPRVGSSHLELRKLTPESLESVEWLPGDVQILPHLRTALGWA
ncbi:(deoxy)nucleoside triphosphate pyrophosphohydrolase [Actinotignum urinale]|uniref:8-oxo-dGTP diphosphatase n=1 Tax=Actinotignum urinale TaxID=190146 RepID=A0AAW9HVU9_9ACTO|nr:NUDIX domain-containing protein [Actinotignum urinale]MDY5133149.1 NUDIX domain-containing protein [Actinotignum urinale]MDY5154440.1 NUDIX domain-containing protein [Actinotignum urinale]